MRRQTRFALLCGLAALAAVSAAAAVTAGGTAGEPAYLKGNVAEFTLNDKWEGARRVGGISQQGVSSVPVAADPPAMVWAPTCGAAKQEAVFRRTVQLLGPPRDASGQWWVISDGIVYSNQVTSISLKVNGHAVYTRAKPPWGGSGFDLAPSALKAFKVGANVLELHVVRPALPKGKTQCNLQGQKPNVAVTAKFHLDFGTDLRVGVQAEKYAARKGTSILVDQFVKNEGPDAALGVELEVYYGGSNSTLDVLGGISISGHPERQERRLGLLGRGRRPPLPDRPARRRGRATTSSSG